MKKETNQIRFMWNGVKVGKGKLQRAHYSFQPAFETPRGLVDNHITLYAKDFEGFSKEVCEAFNVKNNTEIQTDYFETDRFTVYFSDPMISTIAQATIKDLEKAIARCERKGFHDQAKGYYQNIDRINDLLE